MDFVHEDLSLMSQEMDRWRALHKVKVSSKTTPDHFLARRACACCVREKYT